MSSSHRSEKEKGKPTVPCVVGSFVSRLAGQGQADICGKSNRKEKEEDLLSGVARLAIIKFTFVSPESGPLKRVGYIFKLDLKK